MDSLTARQVWGSARTSGQPAASWSSSRPTWTPGRCTCRGRTGRLDVLAVPVQDMRPGLDGLDGLDRIESSVPGLQGRVDQGSIVVAGHSRGQHTAALLPDVGHRRPLDGAGRDWRGRL